MGHSAIRIDSRNEKEGVLVPKKRKGTKNFMDVSLELRKKDFESKAGRYFVDILPVGVQKSLKRAVLETGIESEDGLKWLKHALSDNGNGHPNSPIARGVYEDPYNPRAFKYLYGEEDALSEMDKGYIFTSGAHAIYLRLQSIIEKLPDVIKKERRKLKLKKSEKFVIFNIGAAYGLDTIYMMVEHPELADKVEIVHIDPDEDSLVCGMKYAEKLGVIKSFKFVTEKVENYEKGKAHMILFIGMFCPTPTRQCIFTLKFIKKFLVENGVVIFSTVQEKMLMEGPILDFIMWTYGWRMYFKADDEPGQIATLAGLKHEKAMDWEDEIGHNRMTVARNPKPSVLGRVGDVFKLVKALVL